jgi:hypothetical protein
MKMKLLPLLGILLGGIFWLTATGCENMGLVTGTVTFSGKPCQGSTVTVPPCSGPYANYKVEVYKKGDHSTVIATTVTGAKGEFTLPLEAGEYVIYSQRGVEADDVRENAFTVVKKQEVKIEFAVSTGIQ